MTVEQQRHKPPTSLNRARQLVIACPPFRSQVNLSRIVRLAGSAGIRRLIACGQTKIDKKIARDSTDQVKIERRRSLPAVLRKMRNDGFCLVALEQSNRSTSIYDYRFKRKSVLVIGNERLGIDDDILLLTDDVVEIPVYGLPHSYNVVTATTMAVYEYCRQFPNG